jgi:hypothetical protein
MNLSEFLFSNRDIKLKYRSAADQLDETDALMRNVKNRYCRFQDRLSPVSTVAIGECCFLY